MRSRGLRADVRREGYAKALDGADSLGGRSGSELRPRKALTTLDYLAREQRKPCKIFRGAGEICERPRCGHQRDRHPATWKQSAA